jgi:hypothetical protein
VTNGVTRRMRENAAAANYYRARFVDLARMRRSASARSIPQSFREELAAPRRAAGRRSDRSAQSDKAYRQFVMTILRKLVNLRAVNAEKQQVRAMRAPTTHRRPAALEQ